jgi:hypothetical protein
LAKICNALPIRRDNAYLKSCSKRKRKEGVLNRNDTFKLQITPDRHNAIQNLNYYDLPTPLIFRYHLPYKAHILGLKKSFTVEKFPSGIIPAGRLEAGEASSKSGEDRLLLPLPFSRLLERSVPSSSSSLRGLLLCMAWCCFRFPYNSIKISIEVGKNNRAVYISLFLFFYTILCHYGKYKQKKH